MIFGDKYVFLELSRTGSTYARYILKQIPNSQAVGKKHNMYLDGKHREEFDKKNKVGTIRNPFEFYVSLFAFCCSKRGGLYDRITKKPDIFSYYNVTDVLKVVYLHFKYKKEWMKISEGENSNENFKAFLKMLFEIKPEAYCGYYGLSGINKSAGFLTFYYLKLYTRNFVNDSRKINGHKSLVEYDSNNNFVDVMLRNEILKPQLLENYQYYADSMEIVEKAIANKPPRSKTSTEKKPFHLFYDDELRDFIYEKDRFIFEKYNYSFEDIK